MYNILEHKQAIAQNIQKGFVETAEDIEKAKWQIGEIRVDSRGIAHECYEYTPEGKPRLRRVRRNKSATTENNSGRKQIVQPEKKKNSNKKQDDEKPKKLSELKRGDTVAVVAFNERTRQVRIKSGKIDRVNSNSFSVNQDRYDKKSGDQVNPSKFNPKGYYILIVTPEKLNEKLSSKNGKYDSFDIIGGNPFEKQEDKKQDGEKEENVSNNVLDSTWEKLPKGTNSFEIDGKKLYKYKNGDIAYFDNDEKHIITKEESIILGTDDKPSLMMYAIQKDISPNAFTSVPTSKVVKEYRDGNWEYGRKNVMINGKQTEFEIVMKGNNINAVRLSVGGKSRQTHKGQSDFDSVIESMKKNGIINADK